MAEPLQTSVVINNYNYGRFLGEAIDSALAQTYPHTEVIVVDDGSTDASREVIERYGRRIVPVFKANGGQGSAYNAGFAASRGDAICFLDADDTLFPHAMERAVERMQSSRPAKVQWPLAMTDAAGRPTGELSTKRSPPQGDLRELIICDGPFYDWDLTTGALFARPALETVFPVPEPSYRNGADVYLVTLAPVLGWIANVEEPLGTYRGHGCNNYRGRPLDDDRLRECMRRFEVNCQVLAKQLHLQGQDADVTGWKQRNFNYLWPTRLLQAKHDIARLVPEDAAYILINGDEWGAGEPVPRRRAIPFLERDGAYDGSPTDDEQAIRELTRLRRAGACFVVFWWTAFWWLEHYASFWRHLKDGYNCILDADHLVAFDLRRPAAVDRERRTTLIPPVNRPG